MVRKLVYSTGVITTFAGTGAASYSGDGGLATQATFTTPSSIVTDSSGNTYIEDSDNQVIRKIDSNGIITTIAGVAGNGDWSGDGGLATAAHIGNPTQLALDNSGNLLFVDYNNCVLRSINLSTSIISTLAGDHNCQIANSGDGGLATAASFYDPHGVVVDTLGNIYIADVGSLIRKIDANTGIISTYAGTYNNPGYTGDGGLASAALLNAPVWLAVDRYNNLYIADSGNSSIRKVDYNTKIITTVAGTGVSGYAGDGGLAVNAQLSGPFGVVFNQAGDLIIADTSNNVVRKVDSSTGIINTIAGNGILGYTGDHGQATSAELNQPWGGPI